MDSIEPRRSLTPDQRIAIIEARLSSMTPIWRQRNAALYRGDDGIYVLAYPLGGARLTYVGVAPDGEVRDLTGFPVDGGDIQAVLGAFQAAGLTQMYGNVANWPQRRR